MNSLGPINLWISHDWEYRYASVGHRYLLKNGVTIICLMQHDTSPSHRVDQNVDCGLWNVVPLLFNGCAKLLDIGGNWNMLSYPLLMRIPLVTCLVSIQAMEELGHFQLPGIPYRSLRHWPAHYHAEKWGDGGGWLARQGIAEHSNCYQQNVIVFVVHSLCLPIP